MPQRSEPEGIVPRATGHLIIGSDDLPIAFCEDGQPALPLGGLRP